VNRRFAAKRKMQNAKCKMQMQNGDGASLCCFRVVSVRLLHPVDSCTIALS
jgi:hypothetical protein